MQQIEIQGKSLNITEQKRSNFANCPNTLEDFGIYLKREEKSPATCEKYMRDVQGFLMFLKGRENLPEESADEGSVEHVETDDVLAYKEHLKEENYSPASINGKLSSIRAYLRFFGIEDIHIRNMKVQHTPYVSKRRMLTRNDYDKLLKEAKKAGEKRSALILETICATGMRVSELPYITAEAVRDGEARITLKGKTRKILLCDKLRKKLIRYTKERGITEGPVFVNREGRALHRSYIWQIMKRLAQKAGVELTKVFPHNLRRLFARSFYKARKDIAKLADILGHSSIDTTRIYIATTADEHIRMLDELKLVT